MTIPLRALALHLTLVYLGTAAPVARWSDVGNEMIAGMFRAETARLSHQCLKGVNKLSDWTERREKHQQQLFAMLSLDPRPEKTDLQAVITGRVETNDFRVENLHFQVMPGLYVTANLYLPKTIEQPLPTILYLCGHGQVVKDGISYGNKVAYQHHGAWFARHGYACLLIDTIQLGEIAGVHHGTFREGMWWWNARGYTPAGVEAWNSIRALDYLSTRAEVDTNRFGVTGRSGGGAYSWWVAALDDRVKVAAPVAGITDLENHVVDGTVEGHCDCMFIINTERWDYSQVAALVAPRPLLLVNSDRDYIFPLDGVLRVHRILTQLYELHGARDQLGLVIGPGPHKDTQDLQIPVFRWFNKHLKASDAVIESAATKFFAPEQLKVFARLPSNERTSTIHESFVPLPPPVEPPRTTSEWTVQRDRWLALLGEKTFAGWPVEAAAPPCKQIAETNASGLLLKTYEISVQPELRLRLSLARPVSGRAKRVTLRVLDQVEWTNWSRALEAITRAGSILTNAEASRAQESSLPLGGAREVARSLDLDPEGVTVWFSPRGIGETYGPFDSQKQSHIRRRYMLLGQTQDSMRVWDIRCALRALRTLPETVELPLTLTGQGSMACNVLYASLFEPPVQQLQLRELPPSHRTGPDYLNVLQILDIPHVLAMATERSPVHLQAALPRDWAFAVDTQSRLGWKNLRMSAQAIGSRILR